MQSYTIMYVLLCSLHSICRFSFNYSIKVIVVLTTFSIISIPYLLNSVLQPYFMPIYSIILLYLIICNMSHVLEINYLILSYLILLLLVFSVKVSTRCCSPENKVHDLKQSDWNGRRKGGEYNL